MDDKLVIGGHTFHSRFILGSGKYSLKLIEAAVRDAMFFVNKVHRKPENCGAKSCECMISVHREARYWSRSEQ